MMETLRERKKERTRQAILAAATRLFATQGYSETTITEIAEAAEVGRRTFFSYFPTKEILIFGALERRLDRLEAALAELPPPIALSTMLQTWIEIDAADRTKGDKRDRYHQILRLSSTEPELQLAELRHRQHAEKIIAAALAPTFGEPVDGFRTELVAGAVVAVLFRLGRQRLVAGGDLHETDVREAIRYLEAAMATLIPASAAGGKSPQLSDGRPAKRGNAPATARGSSSSKRPSAIS
jgi:AcrR family transcriptional regulator